MDMKQFFLEQLDREMTANRKVLAEVPEGKDDYKPHERSMPMGYLAVLTAQMPAWIAMILSTEALDLDKRSGSFQRDPASSHAELMKLAEDSYAKGKAALEGAAPENFAESWAVRMGGRELSSGPKHKHLADIFTHLAHHRGQLTVYLRLNGAKVPAIYGPSADEKMG